jgi:hypothetical protein
MENAFCDPVTYKMAPGVEFQATVAPANCFMESLPTILHVNRMNLACPLSSPINFLVCEL